MGIGLDRILLDANTSNIAISDGTDTLAVNSDGSLNAVVTSTDFDIRDLTHSTDSVKVGDGTDFLGVNADGSINSVVTATNLDIRDLTHVSDSIKIGDGTDLLAVNADGSLNVNLTDDGIADDGPDSGNPFKVGGRAHSGLLSLISASNDRFDLFGDMYRRVFINNAYNVGIKASVQMIGATAVQLASTPLPGRKSITIQNVSNQDVWIGHDNTVTADNAATGGLVIPANSSYTDDIGENISIYAISGGAGRTLKILEKG